LKNPFANEFFTIHRADFSLCNTLFGGWVILLSVHMPTPRDRTYKKKYISFFPPLLENFRTSGKIAIFDYFWNFL